MNAFVYKYTIAFFAVTVAGISVKRSIQWESEFRNYTSFYRLVSTYKDQSLIECATKCTENDVCVSFFHDVTCGGCQLHDFDFPSGASHVSFTESPGTIHFRKANSCKLKNYKYSRIQKTYFDPKMAKNISNMEEASRICEKENARLIVIKTEEQLKDVVQSLKPLVLSGHFAGFWVGATLNTTIDEFMWSDGRILQRNDSLWSPNGVKYDPVHSPLAKCVAIYSFFSFTLDDVLCNSTIAMYPLCECLD